MYTFNLKCLLYTIDNLQYILNLPMYILSIDYTTRVSGAEDREHLINVLLDKSHSKVWTIDNFVSADECQVLMEQGRYVLLVHAYIISTCIHVYIYSFAICNPYIKRMYTNENSLTMQCIHELYNYC